MLNWKELRCKNRRCKDVEMGKQTCRSKKIMMWKWENKEEARMQKLKNKDVDMGKQGYGNR